MDKTFAAIEKLKEVELELHRLKNALEFMGRAYDQVCAHRDQLLNDQHMWVEAKLKEKNNEDQN